MTLTFKEIGEDVLNTTKKRILIKVCLFLIISLIFLSVYGFSLENIHFSACLSIVILWAVYLINKDQNAK